MDQAYQSLRIDIKNNRNMQNDEKGMQHHDFDGLYNKIIFCHRELFSESSIYIV